MEEVVQRAFGFSCMTGLRLGDMQRLRWSDIKYVRRIKNKAGIEKDFTYHSSRHSAATLAITAGAELYSVSKILGHGSIASTQVYAKVNMEKKVEAMNLTNGVF